MWGAVAAIVTGACALAYIEHKLTQAKQGGASTQKQEPIKHLPTPDKAGFTSGQSSFAASIFRAAKKLKK